MKGSLVRRLGVLLATLVTITVNVLANILRYNNLGTGEVSAYYDNLFVPAGYVFAIWGIIYIALLSYSIYQVLPSQADNPSLKAIAPAYIISSVANCIWLFLWHFLKIQPTIIFMVIILVSLLYIYLRLNVGKSHVSKGMRWLVHLTFSIYLGWISVATIANASALLSSPNGVSWAGWGISPATWTIIVMAVAMLLGFLMAAIRQDTAYDLVIIWALVGIGVKQITTAPLVGVIAFIFSGVVFALWGLVLAVQPGKNKLA
jgi:translocator protein